MRLSLLAAVAAALATAPSAGASDVCAYADTASPVPVDYVQACVRVGETYEERVATVPGQCVLGVCFTQVEVTRQRLCQPPWASVIVDGTQMVPVINVPGICLLP